jgi:glutathione peroxidase-family protein
MKRLILVFLFVMISSCAVHVQKFPCLRYEERSAHRIEQIRGFGSVEYDEIEMHCVERATIEQSHFEQ